LHCAALRAAHTRYDACTPFACVFSLVYARFSFSYCVHHFRGCLHGSFARARTLLLALFHCGWFTWFGLYACLHAVGCLSHWTHVFVHLADTCLHTVHRFTAHYTLYYVVRSPHCGCRTQLLNNTSRLVAYNADCTLTARFRALPVGFWVRVATARTSPGYLTHHRRQLVWTVKHSRFCRFLRFCRWFGSRLVLCHCAAAPHPSYLSRALRTWFTHWTRPYRVYACRFTCCLDCALCLVGCVLLSRSLAPASRCTDHWLRTRTWFCAPAAPHALTLRRTSLC